MISYDSLYESDRIDLLDSLLYIADSMGTTRSDTTTLSMNDSLTADDGLEV